MKNLFTFLRFPALLLLMALPLQSQVPEGGIRLNATTGTTFQKIGQCTATSVTVADQPFSEGIRVTVGSNINNAWDAQLKFTAVQGIETDDVLLVAFYARTIESQEETGESSLNVVVENNSTYEKQISYNITIGNEWKQYFASAVSGTTLGSSEISYLFHLGFPNQTIEIADVQYLNYKQTLILEDLPMTEITYFGQSPDAAWRAPATERINLHRKGTADLTVYDAEGNLLEGAQIEVEMIQHQFGFGTAIGARTFNENEVYRNKTLEVFNEVVFENDLKWPQFNPQNTGHITRAMDTLDAHQVPIRGHNVIWPSYRFMPDFIEGLGEDELALKNAINNRIDAVTQYTSERLNDWDVINEPYSEHDMQDILGDGVMADWFKRVRKNDRDVKLYLNDYSILSGGGKNTVKQDYYYNLVQYIDNLGGGVQGIGMQGHFGTELTAISKVYSILERFSGLGKDIKITEFDVSTTQRNVQADYTRDFLTICFSHPSVKSVLTWGFWEAKHWKPDAAFYDSTWNLYPHGQQWIDLIYNQWWTPSTVLTSDVSGHASMEGFLGTYKYTVTSRELVSTGTFTLDSSNATGTINQIVISLDENFPAALRIQPSVPGYLCEGETTTLSAPEGIGLSYKWFRNDTLLAAAGASIETSIAGEYRVEVNKAGLSVSSAPYIVEVFPSPVALITYEGSPDLCAGETVTLETPSGSGWTYTWKKGEKLITVDVSSIGVSEAGSYNVVSSTGFCEAVSGPVTITKTEDPVAEIIVSEELPLCEGENVYLLGTIDPSYHYQWYRNGEPIDHTERLLEVNEAGSFQVETILGNCTTLSDPVEVEVNPLPEATITAEGDLAFCEGGSVTLTGNAGDGLLYTWKLGIKTLESTERSVTVSESGSYSLITTLENCSSISDPVTVEVRSSTDPACASHVDETPLKYNVYPNPFSGFFFVEAVQGIPSAMKVELLNPLGEKVFEKETEADSGPFRVPVDYPGVFLLRLSGKDFSRTFVVSSQ